MKMKACPVVIKPPPEFDPLGKEKSNCKLDFLIVSICCLNFIIVGMCASDS